MFDYCTGLTTLDLSSFNTDKVTDMWWMFNDCQRLKTIYVGDDWSTAAVTKSNDMFAYCVSLVGGAGTTYDENHVDASYAHIDGGTSNPGYFSTLIKGDVNGDGDVTIADGVAVLNAMAGESVSGNPDVNGDGDVTIADFVAVLNIMAEQ
jgi:surface protein